MKNSIMCYGSLLMKVYKHANPLGSEPNLSLIWDSADVSRITF